MGSFNSKQVYSEGSPNSVNTTRGREKANGIDYSYIVHKTSTSHGIYQCCVHENFLNRSVCRFRTMPFKIGGTSWQLFLKNENGRLGLFVVYLGYSDVTAIINVNVINSDSNSESIFNAGRHAFSSRQSWGFASLAKIGDLKKRKSEFVCDNHLNLQVELRTVTPRNEQISVKQSTGSATLTWSVKDVSSVGPGFRLMSEYVDACDHSWQIYLYPKGSGSNNNEVGFFVGIGNPPGKFRIRQQIHCNTTKVSEYTRTTEHKFKTQKAHGYVKFMKSDDLLSEDKGFSHDGWITLSVQIDKLEDFRTRKTVLNTVNEGQTLSFSDEGECIICLSNSQTSGFLHGNSSHKCICHSCAKKFDRLLNKGQVRCPLCRKKVDMIIYDCY